MLCGLPTVQQAAIGDCLSIDPFSLDQNGLAPPEVGVRARKPESDLELANIVQRVRNTFLLLGCAALIMLSVWLIRRPAPPDHDTVSPLANVSTTISNALV
jgi:hypothetical protein